MAIAWIGLLRTCTGDKHGLGGALAVGKLEATLVTRSDI